MITDGRDGSNDLSELELVEDGGLSSGIESHHQDPHLLLRKQALEELGEGETHGDLGAAASSSSFFSSFFFFFFFPPPSASDNDDDGCDEGNQI